MLPGSRQKSRCRVAREGEDYVGCCGAHSGLRGCRMRGCGCTAALFAVWVAVWLRTNFIIAPPSATFVIMSLHVTLLPLSTSVTNLRPVCVAALRLLEFCELLLCLSDAALCSYTHTCRFGMLHLVGAAAVLGGWSSVLLLLVGAVLCCCFCLMSSSTPTLGLFFGLHMAGSNVHCCSCFLLLCVDALSVRCCDTAMVPLCAHALGLQRDAALGMRYFVPMHWPCTALRLCSFSAPPPPFSSARITLWSPEARNPSRPGRKRPEHTSVDLTAQEARIADRGQ